ncbi:hypothetical protein [Leptolyngbya sp. FACHB-16]|uniref:hypothetical protein n=1 Tax=unclassified Leptolyngbya TaxID=2650499 RepID=UPI0016844D7D|nr:hypothetical protein [Leptolyngbya sp. FACHB-16]MBD2157015.1 hypothetical protein [Leptolyngbya sp. FACHB-16]
MHLEKLPLTPYRLSVMNANTMKQAIGVFPNQEVVEQALCELQSINFPMHQISIVTQKSNAIEDSADKTDQLPITRVEGAKAGAILGSVGVGFTTLTIGLGILVVPGVGPALALDGILTAFLGSGIASAAGGLYGAFLGCVDPKKYIKLYREQLKQGDYLIILKATENQILSVEPILRHCGVRSWRVYDLPKTLK